MIGLDPESDYLNKAFLWARDIKWVKIYQKVNEKIERQQMSPLTLIMMTIIGMILMKKII